MGTREGRRAFLAQGAALAAGAAATARAAGNEAVGGTGLTGAPWEKVYGAPFNGYGSPSRFEQPVARYLLRFRHM